MKTNDYQYDELQQIGVDYANWEEVARYDVRMQRLRDIKTEINNLVAAASPTVDSNILEFGTGTGEFAIALAKLSQKVCAVDVSPVMLEYARKKAEERGIKNIAFHHAGFLTFDAPSEKFDMIFTQLALHHLPDFWKSIALKNVFNLLKKGGTFFVKDVVYPSGIENYDSFFSDIIKGIESSAGTEFTKEVMEHIRKEYSTLDWVMEGLLKKSGFTIVNTTVENGFFYTYLCTK